MFRKTLRALASSTDGEKSLTEGVFEDTNNALKNNSISSLWPIL